MGPTFVMEQGYTLEDGLASVGHGWASLVREAFDALGPEDKIVQVKNKWGALRIYAENKSKPVNHGEQLQQLLHDLEIRSQSMCAKCSGHRAGGTQVLCLPCLGKSPPQGSIEQEDWLAVTL